MDPLLARILGRSRTIITCLVFLLAAGMVAYVQIPKEADPEITSAMVNVTVLMEGVNPADADRLLVRPLEERYTNLEGLSKMTATAMEGRVNVLLEFEPWVDSDSAIQDIRDETESARIKMPLDIEEPIVEEVNATVWPIVTLGLLGSVDERIMLTHARGLRDEIQTVPEVPRVNIIGVREEVVEIIIDPARIQSYRLSSDDLARVFQRANRLIAAGRLDTGRGSFSITVPGLFESLDDILNVPVKARGNAVVHLADIANVRRSFKDVTSYVRVNGEPAIGLEVMRQVGTNTIAVSQKVREVIAEYQDRLPKSVTINISHDQAINVTNQFNTLQNSVILAVFLVMALVIAVLGLRSGLLVGVAIPSSFLIGILVLYVFEITVSIVVMFGLIIAVGILVDGSIIVVEYADRKMAEGLDRVDAYRLAAQRMAWPIVSSTATTIAAFFPLLFWPGTVGQVMGYMPITLISVLCGSLLVALIFLPSLGGLLGRVSEGSARELSYLSSEKAFDETRLTGLTKTYVSLLHRVLAHPVKTILATILLLIAVVLIYAVAGNGIRFFPVQEPRWTNLYIHALGNLSVKEKDRLVQEVEERIFRQVSFDDFHAVYAWVGESAGAEGDIIGQIEIFFKPWKMRRPGREILADLKSAVDTIPGVFVEIEKPFSSPIGGKPVEIELNSHYPNQLLEALLHVRAGMEAVGGFANTDDARPLPGIEWRLQVDRAEAARFGADIASIGNTVRLITNGVKLGAFRPDDSEDEVDILVRFPSAFRSFAQLDEIRINTNQGLVPMGGFVTRQAVPQNNEITRVDRRRVLTIDSEVAEGQLPAERVAALKDWLRQNPINPQVYLTFRGEEEAQQESGSFLIFAFSLALFLMGAILLVQFNNFYSVLLILSSVILSTSGVLLGYLLTGQPFVVVMSGLGLIALAGIVVNNNIVLIDTYDRLITTASDAKAAIIQTGAQRLRPVFLTTATTALGLVPMALSLSVDFFSRDISFGAPATLWWQQLSVTIIFGLSFSTLLTLFVTPAALMLRARGAEKRAQRTSRPIPAP